MQNVTKLMEQNIKQTQNKTKRKHSSTSTKTKTTTKSTKESTKTAHKTKKHKSKKTTTGTTEKHDLPPPPKLSKASSASTSVVSLNSEPSSTKTDSNSTLSSSSVEKRPKVFAGFEASSVRTIWEQNDSNGLELAEGVCERIAEDLSYKVWELMSQLKCYARHSGGRITRELFNEVLRDHDVPAVLGVMDSEWESIDYEGTFYYQTDKIVELREEYQKDVTVTIPYGPDFQCTWPLEPKSTELLKTYIPNLIYAAVNGDSDAFDMVLKEVAFSPIIGSVHRMFLVKMIQILAFKQNDNLSKRIWRLLRASANNPYARDLLCREEYFHLSEILICQLLAPMESIKRVEVLQNDAKIIKQDDIKTELDYIKVEDEYPEQSTENSNDCIYKLLPDADEESATSEVNSNYFASPVNSNCVWDLCECLGQLAGMNAFFQNECMRHIIKRLEFFFQGREITTTKEHNYLSRAIRGLIALGEYPFREFIPFIYKFSADNIPEELWTDFASAALYLKGPDDIFLYEWLEYVCGADKLQPFMTYKTQYLNKLLKYKRQQPKANLFYIKPVITVRRLEWLNPAQKQNTKYGYAKNNKSKHSMLDYFPEIVAPQVQRKKITVRLLSRRQLVRPTLVPFRDPPQQKTNSNNNNNTNTNTRTTKPLLRQRSVSVAAHPQVPMNPPMFFSTANNSIGGGLINAMYVPMPPNYYMQPRIIPIARRRLLKPLTNAPRLANISNYNLLTI